MNIFIGINEIETKVVTRTETKLKRQAGRQAGDTREKDNSQNRSTKCLYLTSIMIDDHYILSLLEFLFGIRLSPAPVGTKTCGIGLLSVLRIRSGPNSLDATSHYI